MLEWNGRKRREQAWFTLPPEELSKHGVVIGGSGSGKTVTLLRIAYLAYFIYKWNVYYLDAKGDKDTAAAFLSLMGEPGAARMFPAEPFDGWKGDGTALLNRLMSIEEYSEQYYKAIAKKVLTLVCKGRPPRSSKEFLGRFDNLEGQTKLTKPELAGVELRYDAFFNALNGKLDGGVSGWSWDDTQAGYILLDGLALKDEAASVGRYLIEDFAHFAAIRKPMERRCLLIIDEYSAISERGTDAANLFERLRSYGAAIIISSQSYAGLGPNAERILDACNFLIVHANPAPERLTERAGMKGSVTEAHRAEDEAMSGSSTVRLEEEDAIHPDEARRLAPGEAIIISRGRHRKIRVAPAPQTQEEQQEKYLAWINTRMHPAAPDQEEEGSEPKYSESDALKEDELPRREPKHSKPEALREDELPRLEDV